jgi:hypothetical protein
MQELKGFQPSNPAEAAVVQFLHEWSAWWKGLYKEYE